MSKPRFKPSPRARRSSSLLVNVLLCVAALSAASLASCSRRAPESDDGRVLIGLSMDSLVVERWRRDMETFVKAAGDLGARVEVRVADQDPEIQERQVRELAALGIDVLVIVPNDADRVSAVVREIRALGVKVLSYDRLVRTAGVDLYVSFDNEKVGALIAEALVKAAPAGNYVIVNGPRADNNALMLNAGFHRILDPRLEDGRIRLVAEIWPETWTSDAARAGMEEVMAGGADVAAVAAGNDMLAEAAIAVLAENRLAGSVKVAGQDADLAACQRIAEGFQLATVYKPIERLALAAAGFAVMLANGEDIPVDSSISDGKYEVPYVRLEPVLVTRELLDATVILDGFHEAGDVYRNVER
ncbi:MAG: substrate-binding domain-containing protein [Spirochaetales bacterium]|nr:substrate-binding domain-containing protein [Spirochaetales bacterium]